MSVLDDQQIPKPLTTRIINATVIVAALGYFVDIYDLILFGIVRTPSLMDFGYSGDALVDKGVFLINIQMAGMLIGGILWGIWGDKRGRLSVLFGSIAMYSVANIANAFVPNIPLYAVCRFIAGIGLAGELGAGITLVNESMTKEHRGWGIMVVVTFGALGAVVAALIADNFSWHTSYIVGGCLGLVLLITRIGLFESGMFSKFKESNRGMELRALFSDRKRVIKYIHCIVIGLPVWYVVGILVVFSPELATKVLHVDGDIKAGIAILWCYVGLSVGDFLSGTLSQLFKSRKKIIVLYLIMCSVSIFAYLFTRNISPFMFYTFCFVLGTTTGFWALFVTMASEQFGTNIRSTVTTTVPNFVRGVVIPLTYSFKVLADRYDLLTSACIVGVVTMALSFYSITRLKDTYGKDLDYIEMS